MFEVRRPALIWHGGKWNLAPWIIEHLPDHRVYVEPFGGAASVLLRKKRSHTEIYNDLDDEVVNFFRVLRSDKSEQLVDSLRMTPYAASEYFAAREPSDDEVERARRLVVRSLQGFGSHGCQGKAGFRSKGQTTARAWMNYPDALGAVIERLRGVTITNRDAFDVMMEHDAPETLHYVDPPYLPETRDPGSDYAHEMTDEDHEKLLSVLVNLRGKVVLSGYSSCLYDAALRGWKRVERNALADGARPRVEVLWLNFDGPARLL